MAIWQLALILVLIAWPASAQTQTPPVLVTEGTAGYAGFPDESLIHHGVVGIAARDAPHPARQHRPGTGLHFTDRIYAAGELRLGWEPHLRATGGIGVRWR